MRPADHWNSSTGRVIKQEHYIIICSVADSLLWIEVIVAFIIIKVDDNTILTWFGILEMENTILLAQRSHFYLISDLQSNI